MNYFLKLKGSNNKIDTSRINRLSPGFNNFMGFQHDPGVMTVKRIVTAAMVALALMVSACSNSDSKSSGGGNNGNKGTDINALKSNYPAVRGTIKGGWIFGADEENGIQKEMFVYFSSVEMRFAVRCTRNGSSVTASASARILMGSRSFEVVEDAQSKESNGEIDCTARIERGEYDFSINQMDQLVLPNGLALERLYQ